MSNSTPVQSTVQIPEQLLETIHHERGSSYPLYSSVCIQAENLGYISTKEFAAINRIMKIKTGEHREFWEVTFDLMSFFLAEAGEL